jgi:hypothetical protein
MNRDEALNVITIMATAALNDADGADAALAAVKAVKSLDRAPTVAWLLEAARAEGAHREPFGLPESSATPASKETALAGLAAARAALQRRDADG